jgi:hypothetical protein
MTVTNKQIYIPSLVVKGSYVEELGSQEDRIVYPGKKFDLSLSAEDFDSLEDYHTTWINITRAVKSKLKKANETNRTS